MIDGITFAGWCKYSITAKFKTLGRFQNFQGAPVFGSKYPFLVSVTLLRLCHSGAHYI
jgi:hypothetical protein